MTRKHFQLIADVLRDVLIHHMENTKLGSVADIAYVVALSDVAEAMADALATTNPNFKRQRFLNATEIGDGQ